MALFVTGGALALFLSVGVSVQVLNIAFGVWFTELIIFLGVPWVVLRLSARAPAQFAGATAPGLFSLSTGYGFLLGAINFFALVVPIQFVAQSLAPDWMKELFDSTQLFRNQAPIELVLLIVGVGLLAPFCEEFCFRGVLQQGLATRLSSARSIVISALIFSAFHLDPVGFFARFELGILFGVLFWKTKSIWPAVGAHAANNLVSTAVYFSVKDAQPSSEEPSWQAVAFVMLLGGLAMWWLIALGRHFPQLWTPKATATDERVKVPTSALAAVLPWLLGAAAALGLLWAVDHRGIQLNLYDANHPLPRLDKAAPESHRDQREALQTLRGRARRGEVALEQYKTERAKLAELLKENDTGGP